MRKVLKLLAGPLLEGSPALLPRAAPLLLAALLVSQACGRKVAATAAKAARQLEHPLLAALQGLALPQEADEEAQQQPAAAGKAKPSAKKGGKKAAGAGAAAEAKQQQQQQQRAAAAAAQHRTASDAAYNAQVVTALAGAAAADPAAAAALTQLLAECSSGGGEASASLAEPLLLMTAHAAVQLGGQGSAAVAVSLLQHLQKQATAAEEQRQQWLQAGGASAILPSECFEANGVPTGALLATFIAGQLSVPSLRATTVLAALRGVPWGSLAPRGSKVSRDSVIKQPPLPRCILSFMPAFSCPPTASFLAFPSTLPAVPLPSAPGAGPAAATSHALRAALAASTHRPLCSHG